ncbi:hypothetical protein Tco_1389766, partial [Tanacetum coccineum]
MATMAENVIAAGSENCPPMLEKGIVEDLTGQEKLHYDGDIKAVNILLLGLPVDIYTLINNYQTAKEIWDRVKELMECTEMTKQEHEYMLYDEFDKFTSEPGESIHLYNLRYAKLINDMKMIHMSILNMQINTKFVNHLQPEWSRLVTTAKQARDLHNVNFDQLYAFLKHNEKNAKEVREMQQRFSEPFVLLANTYNPPPLYNNQQIQYHTQPSEVYAPTVVQQPPTFQPDTGFVAQTFLPTYDPIASLDKAMIFLSSAYSSRFSPINNQLRTSSNPRTQATIQNGQVTIQNIQATTNFKVDHVDAYDSDCDDEATANAILMANLSPAGSINEDTVKPRYDSDILFEVPHYDTYHESDVLNSNIQELEYIENIVSNNEAYDELTSNNNVSPMLII